MAVEKLIIFIDYAFQPQGAIDNSIDNSRLAFIEIQIFTVCQCTDQKGKR
jgi:hypothetical protein